MKFFFDNCLPCRLAGAIDQLEQPTHEVVHLSEKFDAAAPDDYWLTELAKEGDWIIISADTRITRSPQLRKVWEESRLTAFFLKDPWTKKPLWEQAHMLIKRWPTIRDQAKVIAKGTGMLIPFGTGMRFEPIISKKK